MDEDNLEKLKRENEVDNSRLEELIKQDITPEMQKEVFEVLKQSRLFLPVDFGPDAFKDIENTKPGDRIEGPSGFSIQFLTDHEGRKAVPLFTSEEMMKEAGARTSVMVMYMGDLADMLKQTDRYSVIAINPFTQFDLNMPIEAFLSQFSDEIDIEDIRNDELREFLHEKDWSDNDVKEFGDKLLKSIMIAGCVDADDGTNFVLIWNDENKPHLPLFTDIDEFKKIFDEYNEDVYPQAYHFTDLIKVAHEDLVINPASESLVLDLKMFK
ncbi:SseB family protein [Methanobrevibacter sp.]|uniref:SseB family protein n=1 Tax=Methanobrevibacter sp. TaxID=66852 RepID=UPI00388FC57B